MSLLRSIFHQTKVLSSIAASTARGWRGTMRRRPTTPPSQRLELYEFEGCPYCRLVREALAELQLDATIYPCPTGGTRFREQAYALADGQTTFPLLHDPAPQVVLAESKDIIDYLYRTYTGRSGPTPGVLATLTSAVASAARAGRGSRARPSRPAEVPLELWGFESSPYTRLVREVLSELELPFVLHSMAKEQVADIGIPGLRLTLGRYEPIPGGCREALAERGGKIQVPFLVDPNTGAQMYESADIIDYLERTYAL